MLSCLNGKCTNNSESKSPFGPIVPGPVYELTDGQSLYDDFDGNGGFQTFDKTNLAVAGQLSHNLWVPGDTDEIVNNPVAKGLFSVVNEKGYRVEYRLLERQVQTAGGRRKEIQEIKYVFDAEGKFLDAVPHIPGTPYDGSSELFWIGAKSGSFESQNGPVVVEKGKVYGLAQIVSAGASRYVLKMTNRLTNFSPGNFVFLMLDNPTWIEFADVRTFSADVLLSSLSAGPALSAKLDYHTTIPEQLPGASWATSIGIRRDIEGEISLFAQAYNVNTDYRYKEFLGYAQLDRWYNLRLDIITKRDDSGLGDKEFRVDFYVDGLRLASEIPIDAEILIDPKRTGGGPNRSLIVSKEHEGGDCIAFFDNIRGAYNNRTA